MGSLGLGSGSELGTSLPSKMTSLPVVLVGRAGMAGSRGALVTCSSIVVRGAGSMVAGMVGAEVLPLSSSEYGSGTVPVDESGVERLSGTRLLGEDKCESKEGWGARAVDH